MEALGGPPTAEASREAGHKPVSPLKASRWLLVGEQ